MNGLAKKMSEVFNPLAAIIAYKSDADGSYYLESRKIKDGRFRAGKPLRENDLARLLKGVKDTSSQIVTSLHGIIPPNLLYCSTEVEDMRLVWYCPPEERILFFTKALDIPNGKMLVPGLVYSVSHNKLYVYAYKGNKPKSVLYRAPFFNVYEDSHICLGNAKVKKPDDMTFLNAIGYWENMFWLSEFSSLLESSPIDGNLSTVTKDCIKNHKPFPTNLMHKSKVTLQDILK